MLGAACFFRHLHNDNAQNEDVGENVQEVEVDELVVQEGKLEDGHEDDNDNN